MARLLFPDEGSRLAYRVRGSDLRAVANSTATLYTDAAGTILADVRSYDGTLTPGPVIPGAVVTVDSYSRLPLFWGPDAVDTLYAVIYGGPPAPVTARFDERIDALQTQVATLESSSTPGGQRIALMGDSRTALCTQPGGFTSNGTTYVYDDRSWFLWAQIALGQRLDYILNTAVGGTTTAQQIVQLAPIVASAATHVVHWGFLNDMGVSNNPDPLVTIANLTTIYDSVRAAGKVIVAVIDYLQPAQSAAAQIAANAKVNAFIRKYAREHPNVILWDAAALLIDPDTGFIRASYTIDGTHPNKWGSMILGRSLAATLEPVTRPLSPLITTSNDPYNLVPNGLFLGSIPTGWGATNGAGGAIPGTTTRVTRTDGGPGYLWQIALAATGADTGKIVAFTPSIDVTARIGHVVAPRCYYETGVQGGILDWVNIEHFYAYCSVTAGTGAGASFTLFPASDSASVQSAYFPRAGILQGPSITIPTGATAMRFWAEIATPAAAAGSGTVRLGQAEIHDFTTSGY